MPDRHADNQAAPDDLGKDPGQVGPDSAGQSGDPQELSSTEDMSSQSVEELADNDQALEAATVLGVEEATDHPERPAHTHQEFERRADDIPPQRGPEDTEDAA